MKGYVHVHTPRGYEAYMQTLAIVRDVDDYDYTFEAESTLSKAIDSLRKDDPDKAEDLTFLALSQAEEAKLEKEASGDEDDDDWGEEW